MSLSDVLVKRLCWCANVQAGVDDERGIVVAAHRDKEHKLVVLQ